MSVRSLYEIVGMSAGGMLGRQSELTDCYLMTMMGTVCGVCGS